MTIVSTSFTVPPTPVSAAGKPRQRRILVPLVIVLAAALGLLGTAGYLGASQAIGEHPEWRKMIHTPADYDLSSEVDERSFLVALPHQIAGHLSSDFGVRETVKRADMFDIDLHILLLDRRDLDLRRTGWRGSRCVLPAYRSNHKAHEQQ